MSARGKREASSATPSLTQWTTEHQRTAEHEAAHAVTAILTGLTVRSVSVDPGGRTGTTWTEAPHKPPFATDLTIAAAGLAWELRHWRPRRQSWRDAQGDIAGIFRPGDRGSGTDTHIAWRHQLRFLIAAVRVDRILRTPEVAATVQDIAAALQTQGSRTVPGHTVQQIAGDRLTGRGIRPARPSAHRVSIAGFTLAITTAGPPPKAGER